MDERLSLISGMDIYLIDQIIKGRYSSGDRILDAGCGTGRNLTYFLKSDFEVHAIDRDKECISFLKSAYADKNAEFRQAGLEELPYPDDHFDHIICIAVLHFSQSEGHFKQQMNELSRVLKPGGSLFIRMTTFLGMGKMPDYLGSQQYFLGDDSKRFVVQMQVLEDSMKENSLHHIQTPKAVNVNDLRSMSIFLLEKE